ncbi:MAG TPA: RNA 2',3'-cyclic phosphodiesterase [Candidatus Doudnabacteria bacterium]|nr:RNA 2',3'-cyclic phosphodiesterase [Candidatus Doudnabacteria bacterium]
MRIFLAIPLSDEVKDKIADLRSEFGHLDVRWLDDDNLHITLVPPQEYRDHELANLITDLMRVETPTPFELHFDRFLAGPNLKSPRLLWVIGPTPPELLQLKSNLEQEVRYRPDRGFNLHATLARFNREQLAIQPELGRIRETLHWTMVANEFVIMESSLKHTGAEYNIIGRFPFIATI